MKRARFFPLKQVHNISNNNNDNTSLIPLSNAIHDWSTNDQQQIVKLKECDRPYGQLHVARKDCQVMYSGIAGNYQWFNLHSAVSLHHSMFSKRHKMVIHSDKAVSNATWPDTTREEENHVAVVRLLNSKKASYPQLVWVSTNCQHVIKFSIMHVLSAITKEQNSECALSTTIPTKRTKSRKKSGKCTELHVSHEKIHRWKYLVPNAHIPRLVRAAQVHKRWLMSSCDSTFTALPVCLQALHTNSSRHHSHTIPWPPRQDEPTRTWLNESIRACRMTNATLWCHSKSLGLGCVCGGVHGWWGIFILLVLLLSNDCNTYTTIYQFCISLMCWKLWQFQ